MGHAIADADAPNFVKKPVVSIKLPKGVQAVPARAASPSPSPTRKDGKGKFRKSIN